MEENVLLRVRLDQKAVDEAIKGAAKARNSIDELREANKRLAKAEGDNSVAITQNNIKIKENSQVVRENERIIIANNKVKSKSAGEIEKLRAQLTIVSQEWAKLSKNERENTEAGKALSKQKLDLTEKLKAEEKATGDTRRNVGNYTEGVKDALKQSGLFGRQIAVLEQAQYSYTVAMKGATFATSSFKKVLISTGIGAIIVLIGSLISFLTRFQSGIDKVSQAFAGVNTFVGVFLDALGNLGKQIANSVIPTLKGLGKLITGLVTFDLAKMKEGFNDVGDALNTIKPINLIEVGRAAAQAAKQAASLTKEMQEILRAERTLNVERAKSRALINQLRRDSQDETKTLQEREKALKQAVSLEQAQLQQLIDSKAEQLRIQKELNGLTESTDADLQKEFDLEIEIARLQEESLNKQIELQGQLRGIEAKKKAEQDAAIKAEQEAFEKRRSDQLEALNRELDEINQLNEAKIESAALAVEEITRLEIQGLQARFLEGLISKEEYEQALTDIENAALVARQMNAELAIEEANANLLLSEAERVKIITDAENEIRAVKEAQRDFDIKEKYAEMSRDEAVTDNKKQLAQQSLSMLIDVLGKESAAGKAAASFQALLDTYKGIASALDLPFPFNFIASALIGAQGFATVARINSTPQPQLPSAQASGGGGGGRQTPRRTRSFADGGYTGGGFGLPDSSGYKPAGIVHEGEYVVKKSIVENPNYSGVLNMLEGVRLKGYADGGFVGRSAMSGGSNVEVQALRNDINQLMKRPSIVQVSEINRKQQNVREVQVSSQLRNR